VGSVQIVTISACRRRDVVAGGADGSDRARDRRRAAGQPDPQRLGDKATRLRTMLTEIVGIPGCCAGRVSASRTGS